MKISWIQRDLHDFIRISMDLLRCLFDLNRFNQIPLDLVRFNWILWDLNISNYICVDLALFSLD